VTESTRFRPGRPARGGRVQLRWSMSASRAPVLLSGAPSPPRAARAIVARRLVRGLAAGCPRYFPDLRHLAVKKLK